MTVSDSLSAQPTATEARYYVSPDYRRCPAGIPCNSVINPSTLAIVGTRLVGSVNIVSEVTASAKQAQKQWAAIDVKSRAALLHAIADSIESTDPAPTSLLLTQEMGKPYPESVGEIANCGGIFRYFAEMARDDAGKVAGTTQTGSHQYTTMHPYGVSVHIMPFNFPLLLMCWTVAASLAAGNACIVKPAEATTLSTLDFMRHFDHLPAGLVSCVPGDANTAKALVQSKDTHVVAFTGSVAAAKAVALACAEQLKPSVIEAGGNDPMIISGQAPLDVAVAGAVTAAFHLSGQICTSAERLLVVDSVHDQFVEAFTAQTRSLRIGDGLEKSEIGPLVSQAAQQRIELVVQEAVKAGARVACGGKKPDHLSKGWFYEPTILLDIDPGMRIMREECFGPVAAVCRVKSFDEALAVANDSEFGLGASLFTTSLDEAMTAANALEAGMVWVNNPLIDNDALPFGGWKSSGMGRELGRFGLDSFRQSKMVIIDHAPQIQEWWYPYADSWFYTDNEGGRKLK